MKLGSRVLLVLMLALLFAACTSQLRDVPSTLFVTNEPMSDSLKEYTTFTFKSGDAKGSALIQGYLERTIQSMMEAKGYQRTEEDPDFFISVDWSSNPRQYFLGVGGMFAPAHDHSPFSYWETDPGDIEQYYEHEFQVKLWKWGWEEPVWTYKVNANAMVQDYRVSAASLLKNFMLYIPTIGTAERPGEFVADDEFFAYARHAVANRDWALPGLNTYITFTERHSRRWDVRAFKQEISNPPMIGMYVDLLDNAVHYKVTGNQVELGGHYEVNGEDYYVSLRGTYNGMKFIIDDARPITSSAFAELRTDMIAHSRRIEKVYDVFENAVLPFGAVIEEWDGVPNPFEPTPAGMQQDGPLMEDSEDAGDQDEPQMEEDAVTQAEDEVTDEPVLDQPEETPEESPEVAPEETPEETPEDTPEDTPEK